MDEELSASFLCTDILRGALGYLIVRVDATEIMAYVMNEILLWALEGCQTVNPQESGIPSGIRQDIGLQGLWPVEMAIHID